MKLHYVYYAVKKDGKEKVGATSNPQKRFRKYVSAKLLEVYDCPWKCGDREIELQVKYFGKRDNSIHYAEWIERRKNIDYSYFQTEEFSKKVSEANYKSYASGTRKKVDMSYRTPEYNKKLSKASKKMWENPKRKQYILKGEDLGNSLLTNEQVKYIKKVAFRRKNQFTQVPPNKKSSSELAKELGVKKYIINNILKGKTYTSIN